jgi:hypothetical protein
VGHVGGPGLDLLNSPLPAVPEKTSEVEVRFSAERADKTHVELKHRQLDRRGAGWEGERAAVEGEGGWPLCFQRYVELVNESA